MKTPKLPKDLGIKVGTKAMVLWTGVKKNLEVEIERQENEMVVNLRLLTIANEEIEAERKKLLDESQGLNKAK